MQLATMKRRLSTALSNLIVDDWRLLTMDTARTGGRPVNEVTIAVALAWHLKSVLERSWDVDCEYNRAASSDGSVDVKRIPTLALQRDVDQASGDPGAMTVVRPDVIVHRRGCTGPENNLLVLELKTNHHNQQHEGGSFQSVGGVKDSLGYQHGVLLDLGLKDGDVHPRWRWSRQPDKKAVSVYLEPARDALQVRGREESARRYAERPSSSAAQA